MFFQKARKRFYIIRPVYRVRNMITSTVKISDLLTEERVCLGWPDAKKCDKFQLIQKMADITTSGVSFSNKQKKEIYEALLHREKSMSTGIGEGVALPHASVSFLIEPLISMCILPGGIDFKAIDFQPAEIIVLILSPKGNSQMHISTLGAITKTLHVKSFRQALLKATSSAEVIGLLKANEK